MTTKSKRSSRKQRRKADPRSQEILAPPLDSERRIRVASAFRGPIPPPQLLDAYNQIVPNAAERIISMAEREQEHRHHLEKNVIGSDVRRADYGLVLGFIVALVLGVGGIYLLAIGRRLDGLITALGPLATVAGVFVYVRKTRRRELGERDGSPEK